MRACIYTGDHFHELRKHSELRGSGDDSKALASKLVS